MIHGVIIISDPEVNEMRDIHRMHDEEARVEQREPAREEIGKN